MKVHLIEKRFSTVRADVLVNSTNQGLDISPSLQEAAGIGLRTECVRRYPNGITYGGLAVTGGYGLACKYVFHISLPPYLLVDARQVTFRTLMKCLHEAHKRKAVSIAFPTQGRGFSMYPPDVISDTYTQCVAYFEAQRKHKTSIKDVYLVAGGGNPEQGVQKFLTQTGTVIPPPTFYYYKKHPKLASSKVCTKELDCGHMCCGYRYEAECPPCLDPDCRGNGEQNKEDICVICMDMLGALPIIQSQCGHIFHLKCIRQVLKKRWVGPRINFNFLRCPICSAKLKHPAIRSMLQSVTGLEEDITDKAMLMLRKDGLLFAAEITDRESPYFNDRDRYALDRYQYYMCVDCKKPFYGGIKNGECVHEDREEDATCDKCTHRRILKRKKRLKQEKVKTKDVIEKTTKQCPKCLVRIEKEGGCDFVYCTNCKQTFMWTKHYDLKRLRQKQGTSEKRKATSRNAETKMTDSRALESRNTDSRALESRNADSWMSEFRNSESRNFESRNTEINQTDSRNDESITIESKREEPLLNDPDNND
ncbi:uncharacterized protein LOC128209822 isoform X1 [Mya arenaria]|uniref:uncharacterized protein LOC128209822 isoform X1 n=1 Tax=Mya arenaria TaxID=6604 RepID=UPI0022E5F904|nr:uncharacterized protein LOC128209822 isoform X1 [Mya arenaria]